MSIFMFKKTDTEYFVAEAPSLEDALLKAFEMHLAPKGRTMRLGGMEIVECIERPALCGEMGELMYGI